MTVAEAIEALGGTSELAVALGVVPSAVRNWRMRNAFPKRHYLDITVLAEQRSIDIDRALFREITREITAADRIVESPRP